MALNELFDTTKLSKLEKKLYDSAVIAAFYNADCDDLEYTAIYAKAGAIFDQFPNAKTPAAALLKNFDSSWKAAGLKFMGAINSFEGFLEGSKKKGKESGNIEKDLDSAANGLCKELHDYAVLQVGPDEL